jgi:hypothetical protein
MEADGHDAEAVRENLHRWRLRPLPQGLNAEDAENRAGAEVHGVETTRDSFLRALPPLRVLGVQPLRASKHK